MPKAAVIVSTYNDDHRLKLALLGLVAQEFKDFEVIVSNDGGPLLNGQDKTINLVQSFQGQLRIKYCYLQPESKEFRLAAVRNLAIQQAESEILIFTDGDSIPSRNAVKSVVENFREDRVLLATKKNIHQSLVPYLYNSNSEYLENLFYADDPRLTDPFLAPLFSRMKDTVPQNSWRLCWTCWAGASAKKVREVGGFDEKFRTWGWEDADLGERLVKLGGCKFFALPEAYVYHLDHTKQPGALNANRENPIEPVI